MLEFLVDNIFVVFAGKVFQQTVGIPMGTNCAPRLADIFLYSYEADFIQSLLSTGKKQLASRFNLTYRYIDDVLSINNPELDNYLDQMYPAELEIKDTTESTTSASYLDLLLPIWRDGQLHNSIYDKRDDSYFHITNFPFLSSKIPSSPAYGVFISQLIPVKHLRRRQFDLSIIERTIGIVLGPSTALYRSFLNHCTLTNKAVGLVQTSSEATRS